MTVNKFMTPKTGAPMSPMFRCPAATLNRLDNGSTNMNFGTCTYIGQLQILADYKHTCQPDPGYKMFPSKLSQMSKRGSDCVYIMDGTQRLVDGNSEALAYFQGYMWDWYGSDGAGDDAIPPYGSPADGTANQSGDFAIRWRHFKKSANFLFLDGHVASYPYGELKQGAFRVDRWTRHTPFGG